MRRAGVRRWADVRRRLRVETICDCCGLWNCEAPGCERERERQPARRDVAAYFASFDGRRLCR